MTEGSITVDVRRKPSEVFAYISDLENAPRWVPDLVSIQKTSEGEVGVGTRYEEVVQVGGKEGAGTLEVTELDPPRAFAHSGEGGPVKFTARFTLEPIEGGTRVRHDYTAKLSGFSRMMAPFIGTWMKKNSEAAAANLKRILEAG